jgi:hypothetical protein
MAAVGSLNRFDRESRLEMSIGMARETDAGRKIRSRKAAWSFVGLEGILVAGLLNFSSGGESLMTR